MVKVASGQITLVDLSDAPVLSAFITANKSTTQLYDQSAATYNPSYASSAQTLTLNLTKAGSTATILNNVGKVKWYVVDGATKTEITSTTNTDNQYLSGTHNENLTTKVNIDPSKGSKRFEASGTWKDPVTDLDVQFQAHIDLFVTQIGKEANVLNVYTGNGNTFRNNLPASLTVNADLYKGNTLSNDSKQFKFFYMDTTVTATTSAGYDADGGIGWHLCSSTTTGQTPNVAPNVNTTNQGILTVTPAAVTNAQSYKVVCIDHSTGGNNGHKSSGVATILDMSDPIKIELESSTGSIFKNGQGSTVLKARLYQNGEELDAAGTSASYTYKWTRFDKNGVLDTNFGGADNQYKTGKSITVNATDVSAKAIYNCEVWD